MKIRALLTVLLVVALLGAALPALGQDSDKPSVRVALILPGRADDVSWNQASYDGMNAAVEALADDIDIELTVVEQVYDPVDIEPALLDYAQQGYDLIVGHGFQFQEPIIKVAEDYPDVNFAIGTGYKMAPNVGVYDVKLEQGGYLMGLIAGTLTKSNVVGVTGGVDVSEIHRGHVAFVLGAQAANEDVTVLNNFIGDFNDVAGAKEAALSQINAGADVLWQSGDGVGQGVLKACEEEDVLCMGNTTDQNELAPENTLASFDGLLIGVVGAALYGRRKKLPLRPTLDALAPGLAAFMVALGLAHFLSGDAFGAPVRLPWSIYLWSEYRHPSQVYEILAALAVFLVAYKAPFGLSGKGVRFLLVVALSSAARVVLEAFRGDSLIWPGGFRAAQVVGLIVLAATLYAMHIWARATEPDITPDEIPEKGLH